MFDLIQSMGKVIGHRGAAGLAPENTFTAFNRALAAGCRFIEFDVMLSADGIPFVIHDTTLNRTTNGRGEVGLMTAEYIESLDAGRWFARRYAGEKIPRYEAVLQWMNETGVNANIEIKPYPGKGHDTATAVLTGIRRLWPEDKPLPLVSSFDPEAVQLCHSLAPDMPLGFLMHTWQDNWRTKAAELGCYSIHLHHKIVTAERVKQLKAEGYVVLAYTVNWRRRAKKLLACGVDAVFSDYPNLLS